MTIEESPSTTTGEMVSSLIFGDIRPCTYKQKTLKVPETMGHYKTPTSSQGRAAGLSIGRGDLDQAIRSMRDGRRRTRPQRPVSKIFVDGARTSRLFE